jgi:hypothetical protein
MKILKCYRLDKNAKRVMNLLDVHKELKRHGFAVNREELRARLRSGQVLKTPEGTFQELRHAMKAEQSR